MNKNLEELKEMRIDYFNVKVEMVLAYLIPILEDFEERLKKLENPLIIVQIGQKDIQAKIEKFKIGGTDPD